MAVPTVTAHFGSKKGLLSAVLDVSIAGDDEPVPMAGRSFVDDIAALPAARDKLGRYADELWATMGRVAGVLLALERARRPSIPTPRRSWPRTPTSGSLR